MKKRTITTRGTLRTLEVSTLHRVRAHHHRLLDTVQPHIDAFARGLEEALNTGENGLVWLHTGNRLARLQALVEGHVNAFCREADNVNASAQDQAAAQGKRRTHAP